MHTTAVQPTRTERPDLYRSVDPTQPHQPGLGHVVDRGGCPTLEDDLTGGTRTRIVMQSSVVRSGRCKISTKMGQDYWQSTWLVRLCSVCVHANGGKPRCDGRSDPPRYRWPGHVACWRGSSVASVSRQKEYDAAMCCPQTVIRHSGLRDSTCPLGSIAARPSQQDYGIVGPYFAER